MVLCKWNTYVTYLSRDHAFSYAFSAQQIDEMSLRIHGIYIFSYQLYVYPSALITMIDICESNYNMN